MSLTRRLVLAQFGLGSAVAYSFLLEPRWFELTRTEIHIPGARNSRILHISDLHVSDGLEPKELLRAVETALQCQPDMVLFTGDFVTAAQSSDHAAVEQVARMASRRAPTYGVVGNHDAGTTGDVAKAVARGGMRLLNNRSDRAAGFQLVGVADLWAKEFQEEQAFQHAVADIPTIFLCHNPDGKERARRFRWDLMLSGHTHGGQIRLDPMPTVWAPVKDKRFLAGLHRWEDRQLFITRGVGSPRHIRFGCRPEISILEIRGA